MRFTSINILPLMNQYINPNNFKKEKEKEKEIKRE